MGHATQPMGFMARCQRTTQYCHAVALARGPCALPSSWYFLTWTDMCTLMTDWCPMALADQAACSTLLPPLAFKGHL